MVCCGKIFRSNSKGSASIPNHSLYSLEFGNIGAVLSTSQWHLDVRASFPDKELNLNKTCTIAFDNLITLSCRPSRSHPRSKLPFIRGNVLDLVLLAQDQFLRDVERCLQRLEVGVLVSEQVVTKNVLQDVPLLSLLLT